MTSQAQGNALPVVADPEVWELAVLLLDWHGGDALGEAIDRAKASLHDGNDVAYRMWIEIAVAIREFNRLRLPGERPH